MDVICFSDITWNFLYQRQQQMVSRFPNDWSITFVEPSFWLSLGWSIVNRLPFRREYRPQKNILVTSIVTIPLGDRFGITRRINDRIIAGGMKRLARKRNISGPVLLFYKPRYSCVLGSLGESVVCYDVIDDVLEFEASSGWLEDHVRLLETVSDVMFVSSKNLLGRLDKNKNAFLIGNGVDSSHFARALEGSTGVAPDMARIKGPVIGYVGAVGEWFDFDLLEKLLAGFPDASIVIIGWVFSKQKKILKRLHHDNLHVLGIRQYERLPEYVKAFDVCIIPFLTNDLTQSVNPNKFYEYLASGKPVVTTHLPELGEFADTCRIAGSHEDFLSGVRDAISGEYDSAEALSVARKHDWSIKATKMTELIRKFHSK